MKLNIRRLTENDWSVLPTWWEKWPKWKTPERDFLPEEGLGGLNFNGGDNQFHWIQDGGNNIVGWMFNGGGNIFH